MNKKQKQAHLACEQAIIGKIQGTRHAIRFIGKIIVGFLKMRTSNLAVIANALESEAETESNYKQIQRFLKSFRWRESGFEEFALELSGITGKLDLVMDRTEWKAWQGLDQSADGQRVLSRVVNPCRVESVFPQR